MRSLPIRSGFCAVLLAAAVAAPAIARTRVAPATRGGATLALRGASAGDTVVLATGRHAGPLAITTPVTLCGEPGAVLDGGNQGTALEITAGGVVVEDLEIRGSGPRALTTDSGVKVIGAAQVTLRHLRLRNVLYGIYAERAPGLRVEASDLEGRVRPPDPRGEGNGIHLWYTPDAVLSGNTLSHFQDAVYLSFADDTHVEGNRMHHCGRYGLHTMYCQRSRLVANVFTRNEAGIAIMFSNGLHVERNSMVHNRGPRTYGLLLRDCSAGRFDGNQLVDNTIGVFMDNSNRNRFRENLFQDNGWGVILFASCAGNEFAGNDFIHDDYPVALDMRRTDNRFDDGREGNYWDGSAPYDLDGDGLSDVPYSPVSAFAFVSKQYPDLAVLAKSPAVAALAVAERVFPSLRPSTAVDRFPRVRPVTGTAQAPMADASSRSWPAVVGFASLGAAALLSAARARRAP